MNLSALNSSLKLRTLISFFIASILGVLFHFVYEWSGRQRLIGLFFPINESTWEHLKLIFFPIMLVSLIEYLFLNVKKDGFFCIRLKSALIGMLSTVILFYTYQGVLGKNADWINIAIYFIAMAVAYGYSYKAERTKTTFPLSNLCMFFILLITLCFMIFSVFPPAIGIFEDPVSAAMSVF